MSTTKARRIFTEEVSALCPGEVRLKGWVYRLRILGKTAFIILRDCTGEAQCVIASEALKDHKLKVEDVIEISGTVRAEPRARTGCEVDVSEVHVLNRAGQTLPFQSAANVETVGLDTLLQYRPLSLRTEAVGDIFRIQAAILVYETAHVYRAEPHASSRHLTEYYSLDVEFGFIEGPEDVIQFERELLTDIFANLNVKYGELIRKYRTDLLPSMLDVPIWEFDTCLEILRADFGRTDMEDDLDPLAERQLCERAAQENGIPAVFVLGFPLSARPFYTAPRGSQGAAGSFDLLFQGLEITTGGQRLHRREDLESALRSRFIAPANFESHLAMFDLGMPPHGGFAVGLERLTCQVLNLPNVRQAVLYPRDRYKITP